METSVPSRLADFMYHRESSKRYDFFTESNVMDIHNNGYARGYFDSVTSTKSWRITWKYVKVAKWLKLHLPVYESPIFNRPSEAEVINELKNAITNGVFIDINDSKAIEEFMNLGVKRKEVEGYRGKVIYLVK